MATHHSATPLRSPSDGRLVGLCPASLDSCWTSDGIALSQEEGMRVANEGRRCSTEQ